MNFEIEIGSSRLAITIIKNGGQNAHVKPHPMLAKLPRQYHIHDKFQTFREKAAMDKRMIPFTNRFMVSLLVSRSSIII